MAGRQIEGKGGRRHRLLTSHDLAGIVNGQGSGMGGGVSSVNGKTGSVILTPSDIGAAPNSALQSIVAGTNISVDNTDPRNPVISTGNNSPTPSVAWRILITANNGGSLVEVKELEMAATAGGSNLCTGGTPVATSQANSSNPASGAFDGNKSATDSSGTKWTSALVPSPAAPQGVGYILPAAQVVNEIRLWGCVTGQEIYAAKDFTIQSSHLVTDTGSRVYQDEWSVTGQTGWTGGEGRVFTRP